MKFSDIPQFPHANYTTDVEWRTLDARISDPNDSTWEGCNLEPDFQRGHVWTNDQRSAFVEYGLMGGESSMVITLNHPNYMGSWKGEFVLIDGLQRITAVRMFTRGEVKAFGLYIHEFEDKMRNMAQRFTLRILCLKTRKDVLRQYLLMNSGGVVHSREEIERVKALLAKETP
jgi:hypothetical protein